jgi:small conductance mechanosensitive channel
MQDPLQLVDPSRVADAVVAFAPKIVAALLVLLAFWLLMRVTAPAFRQLLLRAKFAQPLIHLIVDNVYRYVLLTLGLIMAASQLGIDMAAALAGIGVVGIAVGFAAQESVANMIAGYGEVRQITMRTTRIRTPENTYVVIPNKQIIGETLVNHSMFGRTRVNIPVGIAYKEDIRQARSVLLEAAQATEGVLDTPTPDVVATELGGSSVNLEVRVWISNAKEEQPVFFGTLEACKLALDAAGIEIPFPHLQLFVDDVRPPVWEQLAHLGSGPLRQGEN